MFCFYALCKIIVTKKRITIITCIFNLIRIRSLHLLPILYWLFTSHHVGNLKTLLWMSCQGVNMNTLSVYQMCSKMHMLFLSVRFCRRVADWSIYNTFMLTS